MKTILGLSFVAFFFLVSVAWAAANYTGYTNWTTENAKKIERLTKECGSGKIYNRKKCIELAKFTFRAQCKYGINPEACKELRNNKIYK